MQALSGMSAGEPGKNQPAIYALHPDGILRKRGGIAEGRRQLIEGEEPPVYRDYHGAANDGPDSCMMLQFRMLLEVLWNEWYVCYIIEI